MASVRSLGVHRPTALPFLIKEGLLTSDATLNDYTWTTYQDQSDEEVVITKNCVVWSSNAVIRKVFRLEREEQEITSALLTSFPLQDVFDDAPRAPLPAHRVIRPEPLYARPAPHPILRQDQTAAPLGAPSKQSRRALVIILKQHAHIYFLAGPSHIVNLGFEVARAFPAPQGIVLMRKGYVASTKVDLNKSHDDQSHLFSSPILPRTSGVPSYERNSIGTRVDELSLADFFITPKPTATDTLPLLFTLSDPYARVGHFVEAKVLNGNASHFKETSLQRLEAEEDLLYISAADETSCDSTSTTRPLILVVTANRRTGLYSVWYASYSETSTPITPTNEAAEEFTSRSIRRRSSFLTRATMSKGAASRTSAKDHKLFDSKGNRLQDIRQQDSGSVPTTDLATLETSLISPSKTRNRGRTSSLLARAELSSHDQSPYTDLSQTPKNLRGSLRGSTRSLTKGPVKERTALRASGPVTRSAAKARISLVESIRFSEDEAMDIDEEPDRTLLETSQPTALPDPFSGQEKDLILTRLFSRPLTELTYDIELFKLDEVKVFTLLEPDLPRLGLDDTRLMRVCLLHKQSRSLTEMCFKLLRVQESHEDDDSAIFFVPDSDPLVRKYKDVVDAITLRDRNHVRVLHLVQQNHHKSYLRLPPLWAAIDERGILCATLEQQQQSDDNIRFVLPDRLDLCSRSSNGDGQQMEADRVTSIKALINAGGLGCVDLIDDTNAPHRLQIVLKPLNAYVDHILQASRCFLAGLGGEAIWYTWWRMCQVRKDHSLHSEWDALVVALFALALGSSEGLDITKVLQISRADGFAVDCHRNLITLSPQADTLKCKQINLAQKAQQFAASAVGQRERAKHGWLPKAETLPDILGMLHFCYQEMKLNTMSRECANNLASRSFALRHSLTPVLAQIASWLGYNDWVDFYQLEDADMPEVFIDRNILSHLQILPPQAPSPPSILAWLEDTIQAGKSTPFPSLSSIRLGKGSGVKLIDAHITPRTVLLNQLIRTVSPDQSTDQDSQKVLLDQLDIALVESLPENVAAYLRNILQRYSKGHAISSSTRLLNLIGREDLHLLETDNSLAQADTTGLASAPLSIDSRSLAAKVDEQQTKGVNSSGLSGTSRIVDLIYRDDRRVREATLLLDYTRQPTSEYKPRAGSTDKQFLDEQKAHARLVYQRTMAIPAGEGLHSFRTRYPLPTERIKIRTFVNTCLMMPSGQPFSAEIISEEKSGWAYFHSGTSAGLRIAGDAPGLDASWIVLNKPDEVSVRHAGLLLGLGLSGHLKSIPRWLIFKYLTPKHDMTTIGLLLGTSASRIGTMDLMITKLLSVHVPRLLPPGAAELNLSSLTQTAGLMSIGLLFYKTQHRRMSEILVSEVENVDLDDPVNTNAETATAKNEGYRLAAGFALGLTNLGRGHDLRALSGMNVMERLLRVATRAKQTEVVHILDQATAGAIMAIALIFMKTHDTALARKIAVPDTISLVDYVRPDILLLRALAEHLIMWDEIEPTNDWLWNSLPPSLKASVVLNDRQQLGRVKRPLSSEHLALYNILTGLCWAIALKMAGTKMVEARDCILGIYVPIANYAAVRAKTYDEKLTRQTLLRCQHHLLLSAATVMAGSGDLEVFRRCRKQYGTITDPSVFGLHQATTMAIGVLFLGNGRYTFGTSDLAVAALTIAFYPIFPKDAADNRAHLQAFRHFWTFAVEARCLVVKDYDTKQPIVCPVEYAPRGNGIIVSDLAAPVILPDPATLSYVATNSSDYYQVKLDFEHDPHHLVTFRKHQTIFVRRKPLLAQYTTTFSASLAKAASINVNMTSFATYILQKALYAVWTITPEHAAGILPSEHNTNNRDITDVENMSHPRSHGHLNSVVNSSGHTNELRSLMDARTTAADDALVLLALVQSQRRDALMALRFLFSWADMQSKARRKMEWLGGETVELLRAAVIWKSREVKASGANMLKDEQ